MTITVSPFDRIRTNLMNQPTDKKIYDGFVDCVVKTVQKDGVSSLWRGFVSFIFVFVCLFVCFLSSCHISFFHLFIFWIFLTFHFHCMLCALHFVLPCVTLFLFFLFGKRFPFGHVLHPKQLCNS